MPVEIVPENTYFSSYDQPFYITIVTDSDITLEAYYMENKIFERTLTKGKHYLKVWDTVPTYQGISGIRFIWSGLENGETTIRCLYYSGFSRLVRFRDENGGSLSCHVSMFDLANGLVMKLTAPYSGISVPTAYVTSTTYLEVYKRNPDGTVYYWIGLVRDVPDYLIPPKMPADKVFVKLTIDKVAARRYLRVIMPLLAYVPDLVIDAYLNYAGKWQIALFVCKTLGIGGEIWEVTEDNDNIYVTLRVVGGPIAEAIVSLIMFIIKTGVIAMAIYYGLQALSYLIKSIAMVLQPATYITDNYSSVQREIAETAKKIAEDTTLTPDQKERIISMLTTAMVQLGGQVKEAVTAAAPTSTIIAVAIAAFAVGLLLSRVRERE